MVACEPIHHQWRWCTSGGGAWRRHAATIPTILEDSQHCSRDLGASNTVPDSILGPIL